MLYYLSRHVSKGNMNCSSDILFYTVYSITSQYVISGRYLQNVKYTGDLTVTTTVWLLLIWFSAISIHFFDHHSYRRFDHF